MDDISLDDFDTAPVSTARKPNSLEQIEHIDRMIANLQAEKRRLQKRVPLDSIPVVTDLLMKRFGRMPEKGEYIMSSKGNELGPLVRVVNPVVGHDYETDDDEDELPEGSAFILVEPINAKITQIAKDYAMAFGLAELKSKKVFRLLTAEEADQIPRVITGCYKSGPVDYNTPGMTNTETKIKVFATSTAGALKAQTEVLKEIKKELKAAPGWKKWKDKIEHKHEKDCSYGVGVTRVLHYDSDNDKGEQYRSTTEMGFVKLEFFMGKKIPKGNRTVTISACY